MKAKDFLAAMRSELNTARECGVSEVSGWWEPPRRGAMRILINKATFLQGLIRERKERGEIEWF